MIKDREVMCFPASARAKDSAQTGLWEAMHWMAEAMDRFRKSPTRLRKAAQGTSHADDGEEPLLTQWLKVQDGPDEEFLKSLEDFTLDSWDHRTHLRIAWLYMTRLGRRQGMSMIFKSIRAFIENSPRTKRASGRGTTFHATLTYVWGHLVDFAIASTKNHDGQFKTFLMMNPQLSNGGLPLHYYTKTLLFDSAESRKEVVLPDKRPLPSIVTNLKPLEFKAMSGDGPLFPTPPPHTGPLSDCEFLEAVRDKKLPGWKHEDLLRVIWECLRLHGVRKGPDQAIHLLRGFQGGGFHYTITYYWCQVLRMVMVHDWASDVARLDQAAVEREAAYKVTAAAKQAADQAAVNDTRWANALLKTLTETPITTWDTISTTATATVAMAAPRAVNNPSELPPQPVAAQAFEQIIHATSADQEVPMKEMTVIQVQQDIKAEPETLVEATAAASGQEPSATEMAAEVQTQDSVSDDGEWVVLAGVDAAHSNQSGERLKADSQQEGLVGQGREQLANVNTTDSDDYSTACVADSAHRDTPLTALETKQNIHNSEVQPAAAANLSNPVSISVGSPWPPGAWLLESALPEASSLIPTFPELLSGRGYVTEKVKKLVLDSQMYLIHYSKKVIYGDEAARTLVLPDKKPLASVV